MRWEFKILVKNKLIDMMGKDKEKALSIVGEVYFTSWNYHCNSHYIYIIILSLDFIGKNFLAR